MLGPLHFLISTNDVTCVVSDDIALFQVIHSPNDLNINFIYVWVYQALLLNTLKRRCLLFSTSFLPSTSCQQHIVEGYLGVMFSSDAFWTSHINRFCIKCNNFTMSMSSWLFVMILLLCYCLSSSHYIQQCL